MSLKLWRTLGHLYDGLFALKPHRALVQDVARRFVDPSHLTIDFACGTGQLEAYAQDDRNVVPVDLSPTMLARARRRCTRMPMRANITCLPHQSSHFDTGIAINVLYAVPKEQQALAVKEMARVIKPGGRLILVNPIMDELTPLLREHFATANWRDNLRLIVNVPRLAAWVYVLSRQKPEFHFLPEPELLALLETLGLIVESSESCYAGIDRLVVARKEVPCTA
jgi:ubiquinone/menaquinone biosynthesis C-methylase UbiE